MKSVRIALFASIVGLGSLLGSSHYSPAAADGLGLDWLANKQYVNCLTLMNSISHGGGIWGPTRTGAAQAQGFDNGRRQCNQQYYGHQ
jgi:hypothetical protein